MTRTTAVRRTDVWNWWSSSRLHGGTRPLACCLPGRPGQRTNRAGCRGRRLIAASALCLLLMQPAWATTVYRSVGNNGEVLFSDQPPASGTQSEVVHVAAGAATADAGARLRELRLTTRRMVESRREREAERAAARPPAIRYTTNRDFPAPQTATSSQPAPVLWITPRLHGVYPRPPRYPRHRPLSPVRVPPGFQVIQPGNRQLMRPIVSSRD